jgi:tetratricopeptide (TPR) repeat protein
MTTIVRDRIEAAITEVDVRLQRSPNSLKLRFDRGKLLEMLGRNADAMIAYACILNEHPTDVPTLNALGELFLDVDDRATARALFLSAAACAPEDAQTHAHLGCIALLDDDLATARASFMTALGLDSSLASAHHGLAQIAERDGDSVAAEQHRLNGLRHRPITIDRYRGTAAPVRVLALASSTLDNIAVAPFFDPQQFSVATTIVDFIGPDVALPLHDVVFTIIGEADRCQAKLEAAAVLVSRTSAPIINHPLAVQATGRATNARRLREIAGVIAPRIESFERELLLTQAAAGLLAERGFSFPLLVRSPGFHTGEHFLKVDSGMALSTAVASLPGERVFVIEYIDTANPEGHTAKYRVLRIDGTLYPLHCATSSSWKVHYFTADMAHDERHRHLDERFLTDMRGVLGNDVIRRLERIFTVLDLDYAGIDFGLDRAGNVVVFEANALMAVPEPEAGAFWDYRRIHVRRIHAAVQRMLVDRASVSTSDQTIRLQTRLFQ